MTQELEHIRVTSEPLVEERPFLVTTDKNAEIPRNLLNPDFYDPRFENKAHGVTVFIAQGYVVEQLGGKDTVEGAIYNQDERLIQGFTKEIFDEASAKAKTSSGDKENTAHFFEELLRNLYRNPQAELVHMLTGISTNTGQPVKFFGTVNPPPKTPPVSKK